MDGGLNPHEVKEKKSILVSVSINSPISNKIFWLYYWIRDAQVLDKNNDKCNLIMILSN